MSVLMKEKIKWWFTFLLYNGIALAVYCVFIFFHFYKEVDDNIEGTPESLAKEAPENGINFFRILNFAVKIVSFIQLMSFSFLEQFQLAVAEDSTFSIPFIEYIMTFGRKLAVGVSEWGAFVIFFCCLFIVFVDAVIFTIHKILKKVNRYGFTCDVHLLVKTFIYDMMYIPIMSNMLTIFVCTYHCSYAPSSPPLTPYPPLDEYTGISCSSSYSIACFALAVVAIAFFHTRSSYFIAKDFYWEADINTRDLRQKYLEMCIKFILTVLSSMFFFIPYIPLSGNILCFGALLVISFVIPPEHSFGFEMNNLTVSLNFVQFLTSVIALITQLDPKRADFYSLLTIICIPVGAVMGWMAVRPHSIAQSLKYQPLKDLLWNASPEVRLTVAESVLRYMESTLKYNNEDKDEDDWGYRKESCFTRLIKSFSVQSQYHRGFNMDALRDDAASVTLELARRISIPFANTKEHRLQHDLDILLLKEKGLMNTEEEKEEEEEKEKKSMLESADESLDLLCRLTDSDNIGINIRTQMTLFRILLQDRCSLHTSADFDSSWRWINETIREMDDKIPYYMLSNIYLMQKFNNLALAQSNSYIVPLILSYETQFTLKERSELLLSRFFGNLIVGKEIERIMPDLQFYRIYKLLKYIIKAILKQKDWIKHIFYPPKDTTMNEKQVLTRQLQFLSPLLSLTLHPDPKIKNTALLILILIQVRIPSRAEEKEQLLRKKADDEEEERCNYSDSDSLESYDHDYIGDEESDSDEGLFKKTKRKATKFEVKENTYTLDEIVSKMVYIGQITGFSEKPKEAIEINPPLLNNVYQAIEKVNDLSKPLRIGDDEDFDSNMFNNLLKKCTKGALFVSSFFSISSVSELTEKSSPSFSGNNLFLSHPLYIEYNNIELRLSPYILSIIEGNSSPLHQYEPILDSDYDRRFPCQVYASQIKYCTDYKKYRSFWDENENNFNTSSSLENQLDSVIDEVKQLGSVLCNSTFRFATLDKDDFQKLFIKQLVTLSTLLDENSESVDNYKKIKDCSFHILESPFISIKFWGGLTKAFEIGINDNDEDSERSLKALSKSFFLSERIDNDINRYGLDEALEGILKSFRDHPDMLFNENTEMIERFISKAISMFSRRRNAYLLMIKMFGVHILNNFDLDELGDDEFPFFCYVCGLLKEWMDVGIKALFITQPRLYLKLLGSSSLVDSDIFNSVSMKDLNDVPFANKVWIKEAVHILQFFQNCFKYNSKHTAFLVQHKSLKTTNNTFYVADEFSADVNEYKINKINAWLLNPLVEDDEVENDLHINEKKMKEIFSKVQRKTSKNYWRSSSDMFFSFIVSEEKKSFFLLRYGAYLTKLRKKGEDFEGQPVIKNPPEIEEKDMKNYEVFKEIENKENLDVDTATTSTTSTVSSNKPSFYKYSPKDYSSNKTLELMNQYFEGRTEIHERKVYDKEEKGAKYVLSTENEVESLAIHLISFCLFSEVTEIRINALLALLFMLCPFKRETDNCDVSTLVLIGRKVSSSLIPYALRCNIDIFNGCERSRIMKENKDIQEEENKDNKLERKRDGRRDRREGIMRDNIVRRRRRRREESDDSKEVIKDSIQNNETIKNKSKNKANDDTEDILLNILSLHCLVYLCNVAFHPQIPLPPSTRCSLISNIFSCRSVIEWVGAFDTSKYEVEYIVSKTLFILISNSDEYTLSSLCNNSRFSVVKKLLNFNGSYTTKRYSALSLIQIIDGGFSEKIENTKENYSFLFNCILSLLPLLTDTLLYRPVCLFCEKYLIFTDVLEEAKKLYDEEISENLNDVLEMVGEDREDEFYSEDIVLKKKKRGFFDDSESEDNNSDSSEDSNNDDSGNENSDSVDNNSRIILSESDGDSDNDNSDLNLHSGFSDNDDENSNENNNDIEINTESDKDKRKNLKLTKKENNYKMEEGKNSRLDDDKKETDGVEKEIEKEKENNIDLEMTSNINGNSDNNNNTVSVDINSSMNFNNRNSNLRTRRRRRNLT